MRIQLKVLPLAALIMVWGGGSFAASDPFEAEVFLTPYGEVPSPLVTTSPEATYEAAADAAPTEAPIGIIMDFPEERYIPLVATAEETLGAADDAVELALYPDNFLASETETAAVIAADLASLSEMTGSVDVAERLEIACLDGEEDR
jgi:hypothetical protein